MPGLHRIERLEFQIGYADEATAWAHAQRVQHFAAGPATAVIAAVFDQISDGDAVHRWATLDLDLGVLGIDASDDAWAEQLREALRGALGAGAGIAPGPATAGATVRSRQQIDLEQMQWWLQHGHLPWQAGPVDAHGASFDQLAERLLSEQGPALVHALWQASAHGHGHGHEHGRGTEADHGHPLAGRLERVALQWPLPLLERLAQAMALPAPGGLALVGPPVATVGVGAADARRGWLRRALTALGAGGAAGVAVEPPRAATPGPGADTPTASVAGSDASRTGLAATAQVAAAPVVGLNAEFDPEFGCVPCPGPDDGRDDTADPVAIEPAPAGDVETPPGAAHDPADTITPGPAPDPGARPATSLVDRAQANPPGRPPNTALSAAPVAYGADGAAPGIAGLRRLALPSSTWRTFTSRWSAADRMALIGALAPADAGQLCALAEAAARHVGAGALDAASAAGDVWAFLLHRLAGPPAQAPGTREAWLDGLANHLLAAGAPDPIALRQALAAAWPSPGGLSTQAAASVNAGQIETAALGDGDRMRRRSRTAEDADAPAQPGALPHRSPGEAAPDMANATADASRMACGGRSMHLDGLADRCDAAPVPVPVPVPVPAPAPAAAAAANPPKMADRAPAAVPAAARRGDAHPCTAAETLFAASRCLHLLALACARAGLLKDVDALRHTDAALLAREVGTAGRDGGFDLAAFVWRWLDAQQTTLGSPSAGRASAAAVLEAASPMRRAQRLAQALRAADTAGPGLAVRQTVAIGGFARAVAAAEPAPGHRADPAAPEPGQPARSPIETPGRPQDDARSTVRPPAAVAPLGGPHPVLRHGPIPTGLPTDPQRGVPQDPDPRSPSNAPPTGSPHGRASAPAASATTPGASPTPGRPHHTLAGPGATVQGPLGAAASAGHARTESPATAAGVSAPSNREAQTGVPDAREATPGIRLATGPANVNGATLQKRPDRARPDAAKDAEPGAAVTHPAPSVGAERDSGPPSPEPPSGMATGRAASPLAPPPWAADAAALHSARDVLAADGALLRQRLAALVAAAASAPSAPAASPPPAPAALGGPAPSARAPGTGAPDDTVYIGNAGLVLAAPYLPRLLSRLGLLVDDRFADEAAARRAVQVLQVVVDGRPETPEHRLALNKLLCGLPLANPVAREIELTAAEQHAITSLLEALIGHWTALGRTSVAGLRETFLQREGALRRADDGWQLLVQARPFDMLLDRLPWGFRTCRFPWMDQVLHVDWR